MDNIIIFGHSVSQGFWDEKGGWVQRLRSFLDKRALKTQDEEKVFYTFNASISGDTTEDILERLEEEYRRRGGEEYEELLLIQIGTNDAIIEDGESRVSKKDFSDNMGKITELGKKLSDHLIIVGDFPVNPEMEEIPYAPQKILRNSDVREYDEEKKKICREKDVDFIDLFELMDSRKNMEYLEEGVHPNSKGHKLVYEKVKEVLQNEKMI